MVNDMHTRRRLSRRVRRFFVLQENLERSRGHRRCIKECSTAVAQATGALLNATRPGMPHRMIQTFRILDNKCTEKSVLPAIGHGIPRVGHVC